MFSSLFHAFTSFRLGYSPLPPQPYPGRWTTPLIILFFAFLTSGLVCINIPLSAYEFIQELTYRPNDTIPALPMSNWLPSFLQIPKVSFTPQVLAVGSTIALNGSMFRFKILDAVDNSNENDPVSTFAYSNNPFSEACDVMNMTISYHISITVSNSSFVIRTASAEISAAVLCHTPQTTFTCSLDMNTADSDPPILSSNPAEDMLAGMTSDFESALFDWIMVFDQPWNAEPEINTEFWFACTVVANSTCHTSSDSGCPDNQPVRINQAPFNSACSADLSQPGSKNVWPEGTFSFTDSLEPYVHTDDNDSANALFPRYNNDTQLQLTMSTIVQNVYQTLFHTLRLELGVILPNQIFASPQMFNDSIISIFKPAAFKSVAMSFDTITNARASTTNKTVLAQWKDMVDYYNTTDRVPVMEYSRTVPRLKPLGSAITSIFVATFAMLSSIWTIFSLVAGALAKMYSDHKSLAVPDPEKQETLSVGEVCMDAPLLSETDKETQSTDRDRLRNLEHEFASLKETLHQIQLTLRKRGPVAWTDSQSTSE
ncbi:hypothetical protein R3P38DRAFT_69472 [Favolaschia claudopus]|uniref:Uncharacterized protein n=1 Tax=Favolaschia claudopus TaxID=2862362 RepID=A0AAW0D7I9_9AGAR